MSDADLNMTVLRRLMKDQERVHTSLVNVARTIFKAGVKISYRVIDKDNCARDYFGKVVDVYPEGLEVMLTVENLTTTKKPRSIKLVQVIGYMQE